MLRAPHARQLRLGPTLELFQPLGFGCHAKNILTWKCLFWGS